MTDAEKLERYEYMTEKNRRNKEAFAEILEKYRDLQIEGATIPAGDALKDLQGLYNALYLLR